jgi:hypothetical protein
MNSLGQNGVIQVVPPAALDAQDQQNATSQAQATQNAQQVIAQGDVSTLVSYIKGQFEIMRNHRNTQAGWSNRLLVALRAFNGQYEESKLQEIRRWGGSQVYMRLIAQKCRAASSLLRDIYLNSERAWAIKPPSDCDIPPEILQSIDQLIKSEQQMIQQTLGKPPGQSDLDKRKRMLLESASDAAKKKAADQAKDAEDKIDEILREGGFYHALAEFLVDLPIFPFGCIKGPVVRVIPTLSWSGGGQPTIEMKPTLTWERVSPFDLWWTPGVASIENASVIEKKQITRAELNELLTLPGYNQDEIKAVLDEYGRGGLYDNWDTTDAERAVLESRENPAWNRSGMMSMMEFNGNVQGRVLQDYGLAVPDDLVDYHVQVWCVGAHVIKAQLSPSPRMRHPYFITSYEKVPGTPVGNGLTDLLTDIQEGANATLRSLINNLSIASGPQVVVDDEQVDPSDNSEDMYPWKRWHAKRNPMAAGSGAQKEPIGFFQPMDNSEKLIKVLEYFTEVADDVSAIPKYVGGQAGSGAGRTASGLAMLMGNASKILQTVSANIDRDVMEQALLQLFDLVLLTDTSGLLTGEERVSVLGVNVAIQRETQRQRQIEFLQTTANPLDQKIMGIAGRGKVLRSVSNTIGLVGDEIVPDDDKLDQMQQQEAQNAANAGAVEAVNKGVDAGVKAGVQRITTEITSGILGTDERLPMGPPTHIGTPPGQPGAGGSPGGEAQPGGAPQGKGGPGDPAAAERPATNMNQAASRAQGSRPTQLATNHMGPTTALTGKPKGPGAVPIQGGNG